MKWKRQIYIGISIAVVVISLLLAIPATVQAGIFQAEAITGYLGTFQSLTTLG